MAVLTNGPPLVTIVSPTLCSNKPQLKFSSGPTLLHGTSSGNANVRRRFKSKSVTISCRIKCFKQENSDSFETETSKDMLESQDKATDSVLGSLGSKTAGTGSSFLAKLIIVLGVALTITLISVGLRQSNQGSFPGIHYLADTSPSSSLPTTTGGFTFRAFGYKIMLPEYAPGWIYFWLLMAAGCGLFISEEALNIWVGTTLARMLSLDGSWQSFVESFSKNAPYIISTILWVYWGVCISDMIPFYLGKLFRKSGASDDVCSKLGIDKDRAMSISRVVQRYGNLVGFVERFSLGVRNPTAFLAGAMDISPEYFFAGVCCGGLVSLPLQLAVGFLMRERPLFALATVATVVGIWTIFPYTVAGLTALFMYLRQRYSTYFLSDMFPVHESTTKDVTACFQMDRHLVAQLDGFCNSSLSSHPSNIKALQIGLVNRTWLRVIYKLTHSL